MAECSARPRSHAMHHGRHAASKCLLLWLWLDILLYIVAGRATAAVAGLAVAENNI
jgi:hypothetical protein